MPHVPTISFRLLSFQAQPIKLTPSILLVTDTWVAALVQRVALEEGILQVPRRRLHECEEG